MASTILMKDVLWEIQILLQDHSPQFEGYSEKELVDWWNAFQDAISSFLPLSCSRVLTIKLRPGTRQDISVLTPAGTKLEDGTAPAANIYGKQLLYPVRNMGADGATPGRAIRMVERDTLDSVNPMWHTQVATAIETIVFNEKTPKVFYTNRAVHGSTAVWAEFALAIAPPRVDNSGVPGTERYRYDGAATDTITVDDEFKDMGVNYVVARAHLKDTKIRNPEKYRIHSELFLGQLNAKVAAVTGNNPNLTVLPGIAQ